MHSLLYVYSYQSEFIEKIILFSNLIKNIEIDHHTSLLSSNVPNSKTYSLIDKFHFGHEQCAQNLGKAGQS